MMAAAELAAVTVIPDAALSAGGAAPAASELSGGDMPAMDVLV